MRVGWSGFTARPASAGDAGVVTANSASQPTVYFCDPHSPCQGGSNENTNGYSASTLPKGTDLSVGTHRQ